jgi:hypothetical protein
MKTRGPATFEFSVQVEYEYIPASRGHRDSYGCPEEPDEPESVEISSVKVQGNEVEVCDKDLEKLSEEILTYLHEQFTEPPYDDER